jgi:hypothetical protein
MKKEMIIVSDLHLAEGNDSPNEDFFYDQEFAQLIKGRKNCHLVFNGDSMDFLQVMARGNFRLTPNEERFGLGTSEKKSAFKMERIMVNHPVFFRALAKFLKQNQLTIISGNHDAEWYWPGVQNTLIKKLQKISTFPKKNVEFKRWFLHIPGLVYIEHGHQYDPVNAFPYVLCPLLPSNKTQIELPYGSFFVRYFFNGLEKTDPLADNYKPPVKYLAVTLRRDPLHVAEVLLKYAEFIGRTWAKSLKPKNIRAERSIAKHHATQLIKLAKKEKIPVSTLHEMDNLRKKILLRQPLFGWQVIRSHLFLREVPLLLAIARQIKELLKVKFVVMAHTHKADKQDWFMDTGTWTQIIDEGKISKKLSYVHIKNGQAKLKTFRS